MENLDRKISVNSENIGTDNGITITPFDYGSNVWEILAKGSQKPFIVKFEERFDAQSVWQISVAKAYVYSLCIEFNGVLSSKTKRSTLKSNVGGITALFKACSYLYGDKYLSHYDQLEIVKIISAISGDKELRSHNSCRAQVSVLDSLHTLSLKTTLANFEYFPNQKVPADWEKIIVENFAPADLNVAEWVNGGSFDIVPFEVSLAVLTYCIEQLRSTELYYLLAWNELIRLHHTQGTLAAENTYISFIKGFGEERPSSAKVVQRIDQEYFQCLQQYFPDANTIAELPLQKIPFALGEALDWNKFYRSACFLAFIILTGVRKSEAQDMRSDAIKRDGKNFVYYTPLHKTNDGVETGRPIGTGLIATIVDVMSKLGYAEYSDISRPLFFDLCHLSTKSQRVATVSFSTEKRNHDKHISDFYDHFLNDHGPEMEQICPKVTAHAFRHAWAEFTMRRFDGYIIPLIADHFRHAPGQFMNFTPAYTAAKLTADEYREIGNRYIFDIIDRYIVGAEDLYGAMGRFIKNMVDEKVEFIDIHDRDERARLIKDIQQAAGRREVNVDSKGICLVDLDTPEQANCTDAYGVPKTDEATADMCTACPMHCKTSSHVEEHKRLTMAYGLHAEQLKDEPILFALFGEEARKEHQIMLAAQKKMET